MATVGVRDLKAHLSRHLKRVEAGTQLRVTSRGRTIATISPVNTPPSVAWAHQLVAEGRARWEGGKPAGASPSPRLRTAAKSASGIVLQDRR